MLLRLWIWLRFLGYSASGFSFCSSDFGFSFCRHFDAWDFFFCRYFELWLQLWIQIQNFLFLDFDHVFGFKFSLWFRLWIWIYFSWVTLTSISALDSNFLFVGCFDFDFDFGFKFSFRKWPRLGFRLWNRKFSDSTLDFIFCRFF